MDDKRMLVALVLFLSLIVGLAVPVLAQTSGQKTMMENLVGNQDLSTMTAMAKSTGMDRLLSGSTPYTLFAPNNGAFSSVPKDSITALLGDKTMLSDLLGYHVVPGKVTYSELGKMTELKTITGKTLPVSKQGGDIMVGGAKVMSQGTDSSNGIIYQVDRVTAPPGFAMPGMAAPQAAVPQQQQQQVSRSVGIPWGWLGLIGAVIAGALALYLLTHRGKKHEETPARYEQIKSRAKETAKTPEETMRDVRESTAAYKEPQIADIAKNVDLPLSGAAATGMGMLLSKGTFKDKPDFVSFLAKTFTQNNMGAAMAGGKEPGVSTVMDIIGKTGIAKGFSDGDTKQFLVPLLMAGFMAVYKYLNKKPAAQIT
ncbi:MAG TPA: fasciclin domain-containing protein [Methanocella sp.]|nr:fasciclin domain-containing protein [Methanocella sp.]